MWEYNLYLNLRSDHQMKREMQAISDSRIFNMIWIISQILKAGVYT